MTGLYNCRRTLVSVAILGTLTMPTAGVGKERAAMAPELQLHVQLLPPEHTPGVPAILISVAHVGLADVWLSRRLAFAAPGGRLPFRVLRLEVKERPAEQLAAVSGRAHVGCT